MDLPETYPECHALRFQFYLILLQCLPLVPLIWFTCVSLPALSSTLLSCVPLPDCWNSLCLSRSTSVHSFCLAFLKSCFVAGFWLWYMQHIFLLWYLHIPAVNTQTCTFDFPELLPSLHVCCSSLLFTWNTKRDQVMVKHRHFILTGCWHQAVVHI